MQRPRLTRAPAHPFEEKQMENFLGVTLSILQ
jgi:hypothetical protein